MEHEGGPDVWTELLSFKRGDVCNVGRQGASRMPDKQQPEERHTSATARAGIFSADKNSDGGNHKYCESLGIQNESHVSSVRKKE